MADIVLLYSMADIILLYTKLTQWHYIKRNKQATLTTSTPLSNPHPQLGFVSDAHCNYKHTDICIGRNRNTMIVIGLFLCANLAE